MPNQTKQKQAVNMIAFTLQGIFFFIGYCFFDVNTVIPVFIDTFTGRVELAGAASTIRQFSTLSVQLLLGTYVVKVSNVPRYLGICLLVGYSMPLVVALALSFQMGNVVLLLIIFFGVALMWICDGLMVIGYYDLLGRTVSAKNRAKVLGYQQLIGGFGAMLAAMLIKKILDLTRIDVTQKYIIIFVLGGCILIFGAIAMFFTKDAEHREVKEKYSLLVEFRKIPHYFKTNRALRKVMLCQICFTSAMMISPYILLLCKEQFQMPDHVVSTMLNYQVLGTLVGGAVSAFLAPKFGNKCIVAVYCGLSILCGVTGISAIHGFGNISFDLFIMVLTSGIAAASWAGFMNVMIDISNKQDTHVFMLINSIITLPLSVVGIVAGQIVKHSGYETLLYVSLLFALGAFVSSIYLIKEKDACVSKAAL